MAKIYDKNYDNQDLTIPAFIWNDASVNGVAKVILTLIKRFTKDGTKTCEALTRQMGQMAHTHEKDIKYNLQQLHNKGHIEMYKDSSSKTGISIRYTYKIENKVQPASSGLF